MYYILLTSYKKIRVSSLMEELKKKNDNLPTGAMIVIFEPRELR